MLASVNPNSERFMDVTNKSKKPLLVPLPGGKRLFLQPGKTGQVTPKALEHPPVAKLLESGDLESAHGAHGPSARAGGKASSPAGGGAAPKGGSGAARQSGDR
ncbi:MAG: hypothetical protein VX633_02195 [Verrucomicrobiota bacterium]|nr:hypothetical protein [Verrucomicrobiota bacterium]